MTDINVLEEAIDILDGEQLRARTAEFRQRLENAGSTVLQGRELSSVMAAACKALEGSMNIEATALGVAGLLEDLLI